MKKKLIVLMIGTLAVSVVAAMAQEVLSQNAVGYIKKTLPADEKLVAMSIPLNSLSEADIVFGRTSVAQEAEQNSQVFFWDEGAQVWVGGLKGIKGWAPGQSNRVVTPGEAFFMKGAAGAPDKDVTITGEVPDEGMVKRVMLGSGNLSAVANPFPVDFKFGESDLAINATQNSEVFFWDEVAQVWVGGLKGIKGWAPGQSNRVVLAGEGFFMKEAAGVTDWDEDKPYTWP